MIRSFLFLLLAALITSCTIEEKTVFNKDYSGTTTISVDVTAMIEILKGMDESAMNKFYQDMQQDKIDSMMEVRNKEEDMLANNLKMKMSFDSASNTMRMGYDFKSLEEANILTKKAIEGNSKGPVNLVLYEWEQEGKVLVMPGANTEGTQAGMGADQLIFAFERTFPKKVQSVSDDRVKISEDRKKLSFRGSFNELTEKPMDKVVVTFK